MRRSRSKEFDESKFSQERQHLFLKATTLQYRFKLGMEQNRFLSLRQRDGNSIALVT